MGIDAIVWVVSCDEHISDECHVTLLRSGNMAVFSDADEAFEAASHLGWRSGEYEGMRCPACYLLTEVTGKEIPNE